MKPKLFIWKLIESKIELLNHTPNISNTVKNCFAFRDLAYQLRRKIGDWFRVLQLLKNGSSTPMSNTNTLENDAAGISSALTIGTDLQLEEAYSAIGDHYRERQQWNQAITYYVQGRNLSKLADCYYTLEEFDSLAKLLDQFTDNHESLVVIE